MPSWFDVVSFDFNPANEDQEGMQRTVYSLNKLIESELDDESAAPNVPANRIVLGGFSQGAGMSLLTGLTLERRLGGVVCLSGWVPMRGKFKSVSASSHNWYSDAWISMCLCVSMCFPDADRPRT